ncbi:phosphoribosyl-ATP diphosphatase [Leadbettera azotonutricia]|uniref:Histidine biosynthesis bifunctional protein HisIE n=1 Tax=Leadbettera azotonutricia (strain ATCC BAA-888 / DSM 13862 / ZAS-9) TaxID=545695 RepID=F5Y985_LEAAZ|nr:phosphoribosyl-ATP diphosphatase [Leadbettera azotonutricia]AEF83020.1 putative imidazole glycerol phosphate synthase subunit HisF [Leadbettera azotonutricia ZAS-9]
MVIASIDIQGGKVVQLRQGAELVLQREDAPGLAKEFDLYGEVAVIDLDAAMGKGSNLEMIKPLLRLAECRVGGGIRSPEQARELVSLGAKKIIVGSNAFRDPAKKGAGIAAGEFKVNTEFLEAISKKIGRERLIVAVDSRNGEIVVDGWKTPTGLKLAEVAIEVAPYAAELLFTCVEREGTMTGIDLEQVKALKKALSWLNDKECSITAAGGVTTLEEVESLAALGCDVQLGMALYTGKINLADAFLRSLNWKKGAPPQPMLPVIAQSRDGQVLMTGFADEEAVSETFKRGNLCFHSRTRSKLWMKGEHSGNTLKVLRLRADCDRDAILAIVEPAGPVCHTGAWSCFGTDRRYTWEYLQSVIAERFSNPKPGSYTATLDADLVREKVMEEADEVCTAKTHDEIVWEAADLLYFTTALITRAGVGVEEVLDELDRRHKK